MGVWEAWSPAAQLGGLATYENPAYLDPLQSTSQETTR